MAISGMLILLPALTLCILNLLNLVVAARDQLAEIYNVPSFDWSAVKPSPDLVWHECYSASSPQDTAQRVLSSPGRKLSCALLSLPLDYHNNSNTHNVSLAITKASSPSSPSHRGTIFTAFGGAGNSRVRDFVSVISSSSFLDVLDPNFEYDFLTFDNRGFGFSSPSARCFDRVLDGALWEERMADLGGVMSTADDEDALNVRLVSATAKGELCGQNSSADGDIRRHMTSTYAARDMLEILKRLKPSLTQCSLSDSSESRHIPKLNFLGASYGTVVGQMFASLYPEHVSRMVLDGAADPSDWVGKWQMNHLDDMDAIWASFYKDCFEAKEKCDLWRTSDSNSAQIARRVSRFIESMKYLPAYMMSDRNARLITYRDVKIAIYWTAMTPASSSSLMAKALDGLMRGQTNVSFPFENDPLALDYRDGESQDSRAAANADAGTALNCGDAEDITNATVAEFRKYLSALETLSSEAAFFQGERRIRCMGWQLRPAWRYTGPFSTRWENGTSKLSTPLLLIGNRLDPMTSIRNSFDLVENYPGSVVLEQDSRGHCAIGEFLDPCTFGYLRSYFRDGTLPEQGTVCGEDCNIFDGSCFDKESSSTLSLILKRSARQ